MLHGGEIYGENRIEHDFSVNINPLGPSDQVLSAIRESLHDIDKYPDMECMELRLELERTHGIGREKILCGNGASELIQLAVLSLNPKRALLTAPSFLGYEKALRAVGADIIWYYLDKEKGFSLSEEYLSLLERVSPDMAILCNPANPVGNRIDEWLLLETARLCGEKGIGLLLDECFRGLTADGDAKSMRYLVGSNPYLMIVDAFTKRFAMPGIRLGYLFTSNEGWIKRMKALQSEWSVSLPAERAGTAALRTPDTYLAEAARTIRQERAFLAENLRKAGFRVYPGEANYILFETDKEIFRPLLKRGILIRHCGNYKGLNDNFYRTAVKSHEENRILIDELKGVLGTWE